MSFFEKVVERRILDEHRKYHARFNEAEWAKLAAIKIASFIESVRKNEEDLWRDALAWHRDEMSPATYESIMRKVKLNQDAIARARAEVDE
jgi:hypothetical protein